MTIQNRTKTAWTLAALAMVILVLTATSANAGTITYVQITNDADSGISADETYTHKLDFGTGSPGALINGVQFDAYNNAANATLNFNRAVASGDLSEHGGNPGHNVSGGLVDLMTDMYYNGNNAVGGTTTWTLSGLTAGMTYDARIYTRQWGAGNDRTAAFAFDPDGAGPISDSTGPINQDDATSVGFANGNDAYYINYQFKAVSGQDMVITATQSLVNQSWHLYGISNQEAVLPNTASHPNPADGSRTPPTGVDDDGLYMLMTFAAGYGATTHTAYFSSNFDDVNDRNPAVSLGDPPYPAAYPTGYYAGMDDPALPDFARTPLERGVTYYWAVDESNDTASYPGYVWSYTIASKAAWDPTPPDGQEFVGTDGAMTWKLGDLNPTGFTLTYDIYISTDETAVENVATGDTTSPLYAGNVAAESYDYTGLADGVENFWRVDTKLALTRPPFTATIEKGDVWSFETLPTPPDFPIDDEDLVAHWKLDGEYPYWVVDYSGYGNHGVRQGDPTYAPGHEDNALDFDGNGDYVDIGYNPELSINEFTMSAWVKIATEPGTFGVHGTRVGGDTTFDFKVMANNIHGDIGSGTAWIDTAIDIGPGDTGANGQGGDLAVDTWYMITYVIDNTNQQVKLYLDGDLKRTIVIAGIPLLMKAGQSMRIGHTGTGSEWMNGLIDDVRIYKRVLSIKEIKMLAGLFAASGANPANGATDVSRTPTLGWSPGVFAAATNGSVLYYGADLAAVINRTAPNETLTTPSFPLTMPLGLGETFYWAVDTVNGVDIWPGDLWSFTTTNWISVDDMESYTPWTTTGNDIFVSWRDGEGDCSDGNGNQTGSTLTENASPVLGGVQSMKYDFDNDGMVYSPCSLDQKTRLYLYSKIEAQVAALPSGIGTDWTTEGVEALSLPFAGQLGNSTTDSLWVQLQDGSKGYGDKVFYGDYAGESLADFNDVSWHDWNIDLDDFNVNLTDIVSIVIGIGTEGSAVPGGSGTLFFDEFRLYTPRCAPQRAKPAADFDDNCQVDYRDAEAMFDWWLFRDIPETTWTGAWQSADIGDVNVPGSFTDLGGGAYTITGRGADIWNTADAFHFAHQSLSGDGQLTVRVTDIAGPSANTWRKAGVMIRETLDAGSAHAFMAATPGGGGGLSFQWRPTTGSSSNNSDGPAGVVVPTCVRIVRIGDTFRGFHYRSGEWTQQGAAVTIPMAEDVYIGLAVTSHEATSSSTAAFDRACSTEFLSMDILDDKVINFGDYAELMNEWLDKVYWP